MVELLVAGAGGSPTRLLLRPNPPLPRRGRMTFLGILAAVMGSYALLLAGRGFWLVLPFAGLELGALAAALHVSARRASCVETVEINDCDLRIRRRDPYRTATAEFASGWARVRLTPRGARWHGLCLEVGSHGRWVELGRFLTEAEQRRAADIMTRALRPYSAW